MATVNILIADEKDGLKLPEWQRTAGIDENGEVYIPAFITDNEQYAVIAAIQDGEQIVDIGDGHALLRLNWLKENFSGDDEMRQEFEKMEKNIKHCASA